jgi:diguanylate cyclase (GGDEF)-like protein
LDLRLIPHAKKLGAFAFLLVCVQASLSLLLHRGFALTACGDLIQCIFLIGICTLVAFNASKWEGRAKLFWLLMTAGFTLWLMAQLLWTYFEVFLRQEIPNPFVGDVILFLHIVPMMGALAVQPHRQQDEYSARLGSLDLLLLLIWWLYLFLFIVIPWQYTYPNEALYGRSFDVLYLSEHIVFLFCVASAWRRSTGTWRGVYAQFFGAGALYAASSIAASVAIDFHLYYTGSLYDVPLVAAMAWFLIAGLVGRRSLPGDAPNAPTKTIFGNRRVWAARLAMAAVFSMPLMVPWAAFAGQAPQSVRTYRLLLTVGIMLSMGILVFVEQHLLDRELIALLRASHQNFEDMSRLKEDLEHKEQSLKWHSKELQRKNIELQQISFTDSLTGAWNRRYLEETLAAEASLVLRGYQRADQSSQDRRVLVFIMVDVDFFKRVNDEYGHKVGDELLQKIAERLSKLVRKSDVLVRWGGEEFLIMSRSADAAGIAVFCERILEVIFSEPFILSNGLKLYKSCSIGWAPYPWCTGAFEAICAEEVIELADSALYLAKSSGKNRSIGYLPSEAASGSPEQINMRSLLDRRSNFVTTVETFGREQSRNYQLNAMDLGFQP